MKDDQTQVIGHADKYLGQCLRTWRVLNKVKQSHAAELLGISQPTVSRIEKGLLLASPTERAAIMKLLAARLTSAADHELIRLVSTSRCSVHVVCDLTHRLIVASPARRAEFRVPYSDLLGTCLWKFATEELQQLEDRMPELGWFDDTAPALEVRSRGRRYDEVVIPHGHYKYVRFRLANGSHARLIETTTYLDPPLRQAA